MEIPLYTVGELFVAFLGVGEMFYGRLNCNTL